jgi:hypothetical protein
MFECSRQRPGGANEVNNQKDRFGIGGTRVVCWLSGFCRQAASQSG